LKAQHHGIRLFWEKWHQKLKSGWRGSRERGREEQGDIEKDLEGEKMKE
jgi:hypothetical protein